MSEKDNSRIYIKYKDNKRVVKIKRYVVEFEG